MNNNKFRDCFAFLVIGATGVGKSTFVASICEKYLKSYKNRSVFIVDPNGTFPKVNYNKSLFEKNRLNYYFISFNDISIVNSFFNGLVVIDDTRLFFRSDRGRDLIDLFIRRRHKSLDFILIYHSFAETHPELFSQTDKIFIFKIIEDYKRAKKKLPAQISEDFFEKKIKTIDKYEYLEVSLR